MSSGFHVGQALRDLRMQRRLSGEELGKRAGLSQSKISRLETGVSVNINLSEVEKILHILEAPQLIRQQVLSALGQPKLAALQRFRIHYSYRDAYEREYNARFIRQIVVNGVPALLQVIEYRQACIKQQGPNSADFREAIQMTMKRQDLLWDEHRRFHFILPESGLYSMAATRAVQRRQLDRLERFIGIHNIKLGIIPLQAGWPAVDICSFMLLDERIVRRSITDGDLETRDGDDVALYLKLFNLLDHTADYGDSALAHIHKAMDYFS